MSETISLKQNRLLHGTGLVGLLTLSHLTMDTLMSMPAALLPILQVEFSLTEGMLALLVGILSFSSSVTQPYFGALSDRFGQRNVLALGLLLNAALMSLIGIVPSVGLLMLVFFVGGLGSGALHPAGASLARMGLERNQGLAVSLFSTGGTLGYAIGPVLILYIIANYGLGFTPWLMIPGILMSMAIYVLVPKNAQLEHETHRTSFDFSILFGSVGILSVASSLAGLSFVTFLSAMPLWLVQSQGLAPDSPIIGWTIAAFTLAAALGGMVLAALNSKISSHILIGGTLLIAPLALFGVFSFEVHSLGFYLMVMLAGALVEASLPLLIVSGQNLAPQSPATASGMIMGFSSGISGLFYIGIGYLQEIIGLVPAMQLSFLAVIPASILAVWILKKKSPKQ